MKWFSGPAPKQAKVYLGIPSHDGKVQNEIINAILSAGKSLGTMTIEGGGALTTNFNKLWTLALNNRRHGFTHFAMLHSDIAIQTPLWCDKMVEIMERMDVDILAIAVRKKDNGGYTSIAIDQPAEHDIGSQRNLTLQEIVSRGKTWSDPALLVGTDVMLVNMEKAWAEEVWFEFQDIITSRMENGIKTFFPISIDGGHAFSGRVKSHGGKIAVTTEIAVTHCGGGRFANNDRSVLLPAPLTVA